MTQTSSSSCPTLALRQAGQSPWLDFISRDFIRSGRLQTLIQKKGLLGVTSNPSIFEKAIGSSGGGYDQEIRKLTRKGMSTIEVYDALTISDIREACDLFFETYCESRGEHGFVSLEVLPNLARDTEKTVSEALRLFKAVDRPNVMIKIPATAECIPAIRRVIGEGVNVNVTLIFSLKQYQATAQAYLDGLADFQRKGGDLGRVHSVASVFVSRIDTLLDKQLLELAGKVKNSDERIELESLCGTAALANSKMIYQEFKKVYASSQATSLRAGGAHVQKLLWGSTSTKNPNYPDLIYVEPLIGRETVNTMPLPTLEAFLDHGSVRPESAEEDLPKVARDLEKLVGLGFDLSAICEKLQRDGVKSFEESFDNLMRALELAREKEVAGKSRVSKLAKISVSLGGKSLSSVMKQSLTDLGRQNFHARLLAGDPTIWKSEEEHRKVILNRLGWMRVQDWMLGKLFEIDQLCAEVKKDGIRDLVLLGMGGSSLAPEVMSLVCKRKAAKVRFHVLDTTDPTSLLRVEKAIKLKTSLFIVASKSGGTIETTSQWNYFFERMRKVYGRKANEANLGRHFVAITDSGSSLQKAAAEKQFRKVFVNPTNIGGRYSALSFFGMVPAALMGIDIRQILRTARGLFSEFESGKVLPKNFSIYLGIFFGELAKQGVNKMTFWSTRSLTSFGTWAEQLVAESTGKEGKGIVPVEGELPADLSTYGKDRLFVVLKMKGESTAALTQKIKAVKKAGFPVVEMEWPNPESIGAEFLRWEIITGVSGAILKINPFDEPNVKESKDNTALLLGELKTNGKFMVPASVAMVSGDLPFDPFFKALKPSGYLALLSYTERSIENKKVLDRIRGVLQRHFRMPVLVGFGPRYLHSIGQLYKGGPRNGLFIEFFADETKDMPVPNAEYTFGQLKMAQALGDLKALKSKDLPVLTIHLGKKILPGLKVFEKKLKDFVGR